MIGGKLVVGGSVAREEGVVESGYVLSRGLVVSARSGLVMLARSCLVASARSGLVL